jgi:hypothetical protein
MIMSRNRLGGVLGAAVLAGALAMTGCAPATATTSTATTGAVSASAARHAAVRGHVNIMVYSINSDGPDLRTIIAGAVGDYGPAVTVDPDGKPDSEHGSEMKLNLTRGSLRLSISALDKKFVSATSHEPIYPATCSDFLSVRAAAPIVAGSGTGAYRGISGSFSVTATLHEVQVKPCQHANATAWQAVVLSGPGTVSLG